MVQSVWLAFSAIYPLPFDEFAHVGAIQIYSEQWSPFVSSQASDTGYVGDLTRELSVLYRWLMSFPYRVLDVFLSFEQTVIALRLINVAMMAGSVGLFYKLLLEWGMSRRLVNMVLLAFVMTPIVPFLAAHVNYDNLMMLLAPVVLLYALRLIRSDKNLIKNLALMVFFGGFAALAKQTFAPLMLIIFMYVLIVIWHRNRRQLKEFISKSWRQAPRGIVAVLLVVGIAGVSLVAAERYIGNYQKFGSFRPACEVVQSVDFCKDFGPWYRNNVTNAQNRPSEPPYSNPLSFSQYWISRMMRGYFAIFQHTPTAGATDREPFGPIVVKPLLPLPIWTATVVAVAGLAAVIKQRRKLWRNQYSRFVLVLSGLYLSNLWLFNYSSYLKMWKAEAIQARYTLPILILIFAVLIQAINWSIANKKLKAGLVLILFLTYVWGGGIAGWIIRADDTWRWQNSVTQTVNRNLQIVLRYTVFH